VGPSLPDTHAHLDDPDLWDRLDVVVEHAREAGIGRILAVGSDLASSRRAVEAARRAPIVYAAVGVHPHNADRFEDERKEVEALLDAEKVVAVGEIGLDYYRSGASRESQIQAFAAQLEWARRRDIPASVHNREADADVLGLIGASGARVVMHAFSSGPDTAETALNLGALISFAGNVTFPRAEALRAVARDIPAGRILVESDAPVLAPQPRRGRTNEPAYAVYTAACLADVRDVDGDLFSEQVRATADRTFHWGSA
jgi:TatD DNase family protein